MFFSPGWGEIANHNTLNVCFFGSCLIVMGTHGRRGIRRLLMGSVTERVIGYASCPVLAAFKSGRPAAFIGIRTEGLIELTIDLLVFLKINYRLGDFVEIAQDFKRNPKLFMLKKISRNDFWEKIPVAPPDLVRFWTEMGAGEIFETETIYSPIKGGMDDTICEINQHFQKKGLPPLLTVFHTGVAVSAYRDEKPRYVILDENTFEITKSFDSLNEWYCFVLRAEYAERYGIEYPGDLIPQD